LKAKRMVLKSLKDRIRKNFNVSIAEVEDNDQWQSAVLAVALVSNDKGLAAFLPDHAGCAVRTHSARLVGLGFRASKRRDAFSGLPKPLELQNEANFPGYWISWIHLKVNKLERQLRHFVAWLRFLDWLRFGSFHRRRWAVFSVWRGGLTR